MVGDFIFRYNFNLQKSCKNSTKRSHMPRFPIHHFRTFCLIGLSSSLLLSTYEWCELQTSCPLYIYIFHCVFSRNKNIIFHYNSTIIRLRNFTWILYYYLICILYSNFSNCPQNTLYSYFYPFWIQNRMAFFIWLSYLLTSGIVSKTFFVFHGINIFWGVQTGYFIECPSV